MFLVLPTGMGTFFVKPPDATSLLRIHIQPVPRPVGNDARPFKIRLSVVFSGLTSFLKYLCTRKLSLDGAVVKTYRHGDDFPLRAFLKQVPRQCCILGRWRRFWCFHPEWPAHGKRARGRAVPVKAFCAPCHSGSRICEGKTKRMRVKKQTELSGCVKKYTVSGKLGIKNKRRK